MDDLSKRGSPDNKLVSLDEDHEVRTWTRRWDVSEEELRRAVASVGNSVAKLDDHFGRSG